MSTIEKALGTLGKQKRERQEQNPNTVERADAAFDSPPAPAPAPTSSDIDPVATETAPTPRAGKPRVSIPFDTLHNRGFITPATPRSAIAEEFRAIKRPLLQNIAGKSANPIPHANLVMITSALEGDGKTFSSVNLAMSIAMEQDKTVLFVDADVLKASAGSLLGVEQNSPGLIDLLRGEVEPEDVILETNLGKLRVLPAGRPDEHATELLASDNMQRLMWEMSARYPDRVIVFDSPPLLLTSESGVLASFMGQIVFVAAADITPQHAVTEALEYIGEDKMVAVMLNRISRRKLGLFGKSFGYGYGYGYGYGSGQRNGASGRGGS